MAIKTTVRPFYAFKMLLVGALCLVLGLWGVWDYFVHIPNQQRAYERFLVCEAVRDTIDLHTASTSDPATRQERREEALGLVNAEIESLIERETAIGETDISSTSDADREQLKAAVESLRGGAQEEWLKVLAIFQAALTNPPPAGQPLSGAHQLAWELAGQGLSAFDDAEPPSPLDRATQIIFILSLPFAPWALWSLVRTKAQVYQLEDDGTLITPDGTFAKDDIADIDMGRWMKKSIAYVVTRDGRRIKLDDLYFRNLHLIVGAIASEFYPDQWTEDARMVKSQQDETPTDEAADEPAESAASSNSDVRRTTH